MVRSIIPAMANPGPFQTSPSDNAKHPKVQIGGGVAAATLDSWKKPKETSQQHGGGPVLVDSQIQLLFWGAYWHTKAASPTTKDITTATKELFSSVWGTQLWQYNGICRPSEPVARMIDSNNDAPVTFTNAGIEDLVRSDIQESYVKLTFPDASDADSSGTDTPGAYTPATTSTAMSCSGFGDDDDSVEQMTNFSDDFGDGGVSEHEAIPVYVVMLPPGSSSSETLDVGAHGNYEQSDGTLVYYAWITNDGSRTLTGPNSVTRILSQVIASCLTNPAASTGPYGFTFNHLGAHGEVGDLEPCEYQIIHDEVTKPFSVGSYYSQVDGRAVLPHLEPVLKVQGTPVFDHCRTTPTESTYEVIVPAALGGLCHLSFDTSNRAFEPWIILPKISYWQTDVISGVAVVRNKHAPARFDIAANINGIIDILSRRNGLNFACAVYDNTLAGRAKRNNNPYGIRAHGTPSMIRGFHGNFELVTALLGGGMAHFYRTPSDDFDKIGTSEASERNPEYSNAAWDTETAYPWTLATAKFAPELKNITGVSLMQDSFGSKSEPPPLELVCVAGGDLYHYTRDYIRKPDDPWHNSDTVVSLRLVTGTPSIIQVGTTFQLLISTDVARNRGIGPGILHFERDTRASKPAWKLVSSIDADAHEQWSGVGFAENSSDGSLHMVGVKGGEVYFKHAVIEGKGTVIWEDDGAGSPILATVW